MIAPCQRAIEKMLGFLRKTKGVDFPPTIQLTNGAPIDVQLRRSAQAKRLSLRVNGTKGTATLTIPPGAGLDQATEFARQKEAWIRKHLAQQPQMQRPEFGGRLLFQGDEYPIQAAQTKRVILENGVIFAPPGGDMLPARCKAWLKQQARQVLTQECDQFAHALGRPYGRLTLRDTTSRWGSCSSAGNLNFSWRIIMAPDDVLSYLAAHEVAHLAEMNHSPAFWATVKRLMPAYEEPKKWLRKHGAQLHRYRFD